MASTSQSFYMIFRPAPGRSSRFLMAAKTLKKGYTTWKVITFPIRQFERASCFSETYIPPEDGHILITGRLVSR
jgi:hypothetical protein